MQISHNTELQIKSGNEDSVWIEGTKGRIKIGRDLLKDEEGEAVKSLADERFQTKCFLSCAKAKRPRVNGAIGDAHMANFIACVRDRSTPISDVFTHHRALTTCHLANISLRLNRNAEMGSGKGRNRRRQRRQWLDRPRTTQRIRNQSVK